MTHRLLCCSDTHGDPPPMMLDESGAVAWLHGGDVMNGPDALDADDDSDPLADPLRAPAARWFADRPIPVYVVRGNHDTGDDYAAFRNAKDVGGIVLQIAPRLYVAGIGWHGKRYIELPTESDLQPACDAVGRQASRLLSPADRLVLLTHYPPRLPGTRKLERDPHNGGLWYDCVRELAEAIKPVAVVQGHVHKWAGTSQTVSVGGADVAIFHPGRAGATLIVNVNDGTAII